MRGCRQDDYFFVACFIGYGEQDRARPIFGTFLKSLLMLATPEIGVTNDHAGYGVGESHALQFKLVIESFGFFRRLGTADGFNVGFGEVLDAEHFAGALFKAAIFFGGDHDGPVPPIAGDDDRLRQGGVLIAPYLFPEFG